MRKTVFIVTEQRSSASEEEARRIVRQRAARWLKGMLETQEEGAPAPSASEQICHRAKEPHR